MEDQRTRTWAEVSLPNLTHNYLALQSLLPRGCRLMGMVKANAYGHGAVPVAKKLEALEADYLGVATLDEAVELREGGITLPILILGGTDPQYAPQLIRYDLTQTVFDVTTAIALSRGAEEAGGRLTIHIKVDTGMGRLGFLCDEAHMEASAAEIHAVCKLPGLLAEGIFTHFAAADEDEGFTMIQFQRFWDVMEKIERLGYSFSIRHCANSPATLQYPSFHLDMVRPGIALYGCYPTPELEGLCDLEPVMSVKSRIAAVREVPAGTSVSYGRTCVLDHDATLAVLPIGYGDGFFRGLSNQYEVLIRGRRAPVAGRICMDMCMVDVTGIPGVAPGDVATIYGRDGAEAQPVEAAAQALDTISYEILCAVGQRVPRLYQETAL